MKYDPKIHSQVHPAHEKPVHVGWYVSRPAGPSTDNFLKYSDNLGLFFYDGERWMLDESGANTSVCWMQNRRWFGLREKP